MNQMQIEFHARSSDPSTSHEAAATVGRFARDHYRRILAAISPYSGSTIYQIAAQSGLDHVAAARRLPELEKAGKVFAEGERPGPTGRNCRVWWLS
jgi:predicted ArsR family transcriptional regulator